MKKSCTLLNYTIYAPPISKSSHSKIYKGTDNITGEIVVIKKIDISQFSKNENILNAWKNRIIQEINIMKKLKHKNIIRYIASIHEGKYIIYIVSEYCNGGDLKTFIEKKKNNKEITNNIIRQIVSGLDYLYKKNIMHRDIKPQNILLHEIKDELIIKIIDFGFSCEWKSEKDMFTTICGTPLYIAPELLSYQKYTLSSDIWSLGIIFYELLLNEFPFCGKQGRYPINVYELKENINYYMKNGFDSEKSKELKESGYYHIIGGMLNINPQKRYQWNIVKNNIDKYIAQMSSENEENIMEDSFNEIDFIYDEVEDYSIISKERKIKYEIFPDEIIKSEPIKIHKDKYIERSASEKNDEMETILGSPIIDDYIKQDDSILLGKNIRRTQSDNMYSCVVSGINYIKHLTSSPISYIKKYSNSV